MKKILLLLVGIVFLQMAQAQDEGIFAHYNITPILINPSAAGFNETHDFQLNARAQWSGFADAPQTYGAQYNGPLGDNFGIGVGVLSESAAQMQRLRAHLNYAFRFQINESIKLSAGFQTQYQQISLDSRVSENGLINLNEDLVNDFMNGKGKFDAALSFFSSFNERTRIGLTFTNLVRLSAEDQDEPILKHYMFFASHKFISPGNNFSFEPSLLVRNVKDIPSQVDINFKAGFLQEQLVTGLSYRSLGSLGILLGTKLSNFQLYYSYDLFFQEFQQYNDGSHEVSLLISLERNKKKGQSNEPYQY